ncbi:MAG TPA: hemerythrin domain-containing protein [Acidimicrobiia bacterium]|nr:hemerythrin domain-containing protein [Acidimicrobiia bacterium]
MGRKKKQARRRQRRRIALITAGAGSALAVTVAAVRRRRTIAHENAVHADVGFMRAMHAALRRDMTRMQAVAPRLDRAENVPRTVDEGWDEFRDELVRHHDAEDRDLWPVLRNHLDAAGDLHEVDLMVEEHQQLLPAVAAVDDALADRHQVTAAAERLGEILHRHLDHEERTIFPLLERHLSRREWRRFLLTERRRTPLRQRPAFLTWVLDDASERDAAAVLAELPPPGRLVYRRVLRPRYAARHRWELEPATT